MDQQQLAKLKIEQTQSFENSLRSRSLKITYEEKREFPFSNRISSYELIGCEHFPNIRDSIAKIVDCWYGDYRVRWPAVADFITEIDNRSKELAVNTHLQQLSLLENGYFALIEGFKNVQEDQLAVKEAKIKELMGELTVAQASAREFLSRREIFRFLPSQDRIQLEEIRNKYTTLLATSSSQLEELQHQTAKSAELEQSLALAEEHLQSLSDAWERSEVLRGLADSKLAGLQIAREELEKLKENWKQKYLDELYVSMKLSELIIRVENFNRETIGNLESSLLHFKEELQNTQISLDISKEDFVKLEQANFIAKFKLASILVLDSARNFLPCSVGNYITKAETILLAAEINSTTSKVSWSFGAFFMIFSIFCGCAKLASWVRWGYQKLMSSSSVIAQQLPTEKKSSEEKKTPRFKKKKTGELGK